MLRHLSRSTFLRAAVFGAVTCSALWLAFVPVRAQDESSPTLSSAAVPAEEVPASPESTLSSHTKLLREMSRKHFSDTRKPTFRPQVPPAVALATRDSIAAATRISLRFNEPTEADTAIEATYGSERTQAPVIAGLFDADASDSWISHEKYRGDRHRSATLAFRVLSSPRNFGAYAVVIDHWHVSEQASALIKTIQLANLESFKTHRTTVAGLLPGVNQFNLRIRYTDARGVTTLGESSTHAVSVEEVAALDLKLGASAQTSVSVYQANLRMYRGRAAWSGEFTLSPALAPANMVVKVQRRGTRLFSQLDLPREVAGDVGGPLMVGTWEDFASLAVPTAVEEDGGGTADATARTPGAAVVALGDRRYRVDVEHLLRASSTLIPLRDQWEYRVLLYHPNHANAVDSVAFGIDAEIGGAAGDFIRVTGDDGSELARGVIE